MLLMPQLCQRHLVFSFMLTALIQPFSPKGWMQPWLQEVTQHLGCGGYRGSPWHQWGWHLSWTRAPLHVPWLDKLTELCQSAETLQTSRIVHRFIQVTCFLGLTRANAAFPLPASAGCVCSCLPEVKQKVLKPLFASRVREVKKKFWKVPRN